MLETPFNNQLVDDIFIQLSSSKFGVHNFSVIFSEKKELLRISFIPEPNYKLIIVDNGGNPLTVASYESPGQNLKMEIVGGLPLIEIPKRIISWTDRLYFELRASGQPPDDLGELSEQIEELISENIEDPERYFESYETLEIRQRLARIEQKFSELEKRGLFSTKEIETLNNTIEQASRDVPVLRKKVWYRLFLNKIMGTVKSIAKSKEGRELIKEAAKKLLGLE